MLIWNNDYSLALSGRMRPASTELRLASAQCWLAASSFIGCISASNLGGTLRPCLIRPKPDLDFKIRILKPWGCKQTECWIRIRFHENKCKIWIYFLSRCHYLSILSERIFSKCHCVVSLTFYCEIVDCEMLKQIVWRFHQTLAHRRPPSWIQWIWLRGWFHGFTNPDSVSENLA